MSRAAKRRSLFFAMFCLAGICLELFQAPHCDDRILALPFRNARIGLLLSMAAIFAAGGSLRLLYRMQPAMILFSVPFFLLLYPTPFFGLGFFVMGNILLVRGDFYKTKKMIKLCASSICLIAGEMLAMLFNGREIFDVVNHAVFTLCFLVFLYDALRRATIRYVARPKPLLSLYANGLSPSERRCLLALLEGKSCKEIAHEFSLSCSTIRNTLCRAYRKLGVRDRCEVAAMAGRFDIAE